MKNAVVFSMIFALVAFTVCLGGCQNGAPHGSGESERIPRISQTTVQAYGYRLVEQKNLSYIGGTVYVLEHIKSGACVQYIACDDKNVSFSLSLSTPSTTNTGAAAVLSRMVLDCAAAYPGKTVFDSIAAKVPATHLAHSADGTVTQFTVATTQEKQLTQLADYFLSCVFEPVLNETVFKREAWHYELDSASAPITVKGAAYERAKANGTNLVRALSALVRESLFPDTAVKNDAYGKASLLPTLTLSELDSYRRAYYVPSNAIIGVYGSLNIEQFLQFLSTDWLSRYEKSTPLAEIPKQEPFAKPKYVYKTVPLAPPAISGALAATGTGSATANALNVAASGTTAANTNKAAYTAQNLTVTALSKGYALSGVTARDIPALLLTVNILNNPNSPLMKALESSGIAQQYALSLNLATRQIQFEVIAHDADSAKASTFEKIITDVFTDIAENGVNQELFDAVKVDFNTNTVLVRENTNRGIDLLSNLAAGEILFASRYALANAPLEAQNADIQHIKSCVKKHLIDNAHSVLVVAEGQTALYAQQQSQEEARLNELKSSLGAQKLNALVTETASYKAALNGVAQKDAQTQESVQKLQVLSAHDLTASVPELRISDETRAGIRLLHTPVSGSVLRTSLLLNLSHLTGEELLYAKLYTALLGNMPAGTMGKEKTAYKLSTLILGMNGSLTPFYTDSACSAAIPIMNISWFTESKNAEQAEKLMSSVLHDTVLDPGTLKVLVALEKATADAALSRDPSQFARRRAAAAVHAPYALDEHLSGVAYYSFVQNVYRQVNKNPSPVIEKLLDVRERMFAPDAHRIPIVATSGNAPSLFTPGLIICEPITGVNNESMAAEGGVYDEQEAKGRPVINLSYTDAPLAHTGDGVLKQSALHEAVIIPANTVCAATAQKIEPQNAVLYALACDILSDAYYGAATATQSGGAYALDAVTVNYASSDNNIEKSVLRLNRAASFAPKAGALRESDIAPYIVSRFMKETAPEGDYTKAFTAQLDYLRGITAAEKAARLNALKNATAADMERVIKSLDTGGRYTVSAKESVIKASSLPFDAVVPLE